MSEPTQFLPTLPSVPQPRMAPPMVVARAVIVYEDRPRRPWRLWAFTAVLLALTVGVILGQTVAFEPSYRPTTANADTVSASPGGVPAAPAESVAASAGPVGPPSAPAGSPSPGSAQRVTAPLGSVKARLLEVTGPSKVLRVRSADLGDRLFDIVTVDGSAAPQLTDTAEGSRLDLAPTRVAGTIGAEIQLNAKVAWKLKLTGGSTEQVIDVAGGSITGIELVGGSGRIVMDLPAPKGTVPLSLTGPAGDVSVRTKSGTPVRLRLQAGAGSAEVDGKLQQQVKAGTTVMSEGWPAAKNRYDLISTGAVKSVSVS